MHSRYWLNWFCSEYWLCSGYWFHWGYWCPSEYWFHSGHLDSMPLSTLTLSAQNTGSQKMAFGLNTVPDWVTGPIKIQIPLGAFTDLIAPSFFWPTCATPGDLPHSGHWFRQERSLTETQMLTRQDFPSQDKSDTQQENSPELRDWLFSHFHQPQLCVPFTLEPASGTSLEEHSPATEWRVLFCYDHVSGTVTYHSASRPCVYIWITIRVLGSVESQHNDGLVPFLEKKWDTAVVSTQNHAATQLTKSRSQTHSVILEGRIAAGDRFSWSAKSTVAKPAWRQHNNLIPQVQILGHAFMQSMHGFCLLPVASGARLTLTFHGHILSLFLSFLSVCCLQTLFLPFPLSLYLSSVCYFCLSLSLCLSVSPSLFVSSFFLLIGLTHKKNFQSKTSLTFCRRLQGCNSWGCTCLCMQASIESYPFFPSEFESFNSLSISDQNS